MNWRPAAVWLLSGLVFGIGLSWSGMINPRKVLAFLDVTGAWDPTLLLVMVSAVTVTLVTFRLVLRRPNPWVGQFALPTRREIDWPLAAGAAIFGLGWGMAGYCPGPAIAAFAVDWREPSIFVTAMAAGMLLQRRLFR